MDSGDKFKRILVTGGAGMFVVQCVFFIFGYFVCF